MILYITKRTKQITLRSCDHAS